MVRAAAWKPKAGELVIVTVLGRIDSITRLQKPLTKDDEPLYRVLIEFPDGDGTVQELTGEDVHYLAGETA